MTPEQKQRSLQLIADWSVVTKAVTPAATYFKGEQMAALLQELVEAQSAQDAELVTVPRELLGAACYAIEKNLPAPKILEQLRSYALGGVAAPPAPSVPDVANTFKRRAEEIVAMAVNRENYAKINRTIADLVTDIANAAETTTQAESPADVARDAWYGSNPPSLVQATAIYMALLEAAKNQQKLSDERILELFYEHATPDRWPFGFARAIGAAMREKGQS